MTCKSEFNPIWTLSTWFRKSDCCSKALKWGICRVMQRKILLSHQKQQGICFLGRSEGILWRPPLKSTGRYWSNLPSLLLKSGSTGVQLLIPWYAYGLIRTHSDGIPRTCACWRLCCTAQQTFYIFDEHHQACPSAGWRCGGSVHIGTCFLSRNFQLHFSDCCTAPPFLGSLCPHMLPRPTQTYLRSLDDLSEVTLSGHCDKIGSAQ